MRLMEALFILSLIMKAINDTSNKVSPLLTGNISESGWSKLACKWVELYKKY